MPDLSRETFGSFLDIEKDPVDRQDAKRMKKAEDIMNPYLDKKKAK